MLDLAVFERDAEAFQRAASYARYLYDAGFAATLDLATLYDDFTYLFRDDMYGEMLEAEVEPRPKRYLLDFVASGYLDDRSRDFDARLAAADAASAVAWDDRPLPARAVPLVLANEPDAHRRHALEALSHAATARLNPLREERQRTRVESTEKLGRSDYVALIDELRDLQLADLSEAARRFLEVTERDYLDALDELLGTIGLAPADATAGDLAWLFRLPQLDAQFDAKSRLPALHRTLRDLGVDFEEQAGVSLDAEPRPLKSAAPFWAPLAIPRDVRLVMAPAGGRLDYAALFYLAGAGEMYVNTDRTLAFPYRWLGDGSVVESHARLFAHLLVDPAWLERYLEFENPADYLRVATFQRLYLVRRDAALLLYEPELHRADDFERLAQRYVELLTATLGLEHTPERYLVDVAGDFDSARRFRAWIFEAQFRHYLQREYDEEWYRMPRAGRFLRDLWREAQMYPVDELARFMGASGLDLRPLTEELTAGVR